MYPDHNLLKKKSNNVVNKDEFVFVEVSNGIYFVDKSPDPYCDKYISNDKVIRILNDDYTSVTIKNKEWEVIYEK